MIHEAGETIDELTARVNRTLTTEAQVAEAARVNRTLATEAQVAEGAHVLSEHYNDNAPLGESRYAEVARSVFAAMMAVDPNASPRRLF